MESEKFKKRILISGYKPLDFKTDDGGRLQICKVMYQFEGDNENTFGIQQEELNFPLDYKEKFKNVKFPVNGIVTFTCDNLVKRPVLEDLEIVNLNK